MHRICCLAALTCAVAGMTSTAAATPLVIDDFSVAPASPVQFDTSGPDSSILGGTRRSIGSTGITFAGAGTGELQMDSNFVFASEPSFIVWNSDGAGLGGIDITSYDAFELELTSNRSLPIAFEFNLAITVIDVNDDITTFTTSSIEETTLFTFGDAIGSADLALVDFVSLEVEIISSGTEINLDHFQLVPSPGPAALLAVGGLAAVRRRRG
ncbi:MAG: hypothetical protein AAFX05_14195 [Planctomycetota bacterium]